MLTSPTPKQATDLAGRLHLHPHYIQTRTRINLLVERFLALGILHARLRDLPAQFRDPQPRPWESIDWQEINQNQIVGVSPEVFLLVIAGAMEIEAPIRDYSKESWGYLEKVHPQLARFMGGTFGESGSIAELGVWEKEERQHCPTFAKIYLQLTEVKLTPKPNTVKGYQSSGNPREDVYRHGLNRIATEWSATSIYLWLMSHSTGALQQAISEPMQDEINHLAKFWGIGRWAFPEPYIKRLTKTTQQLTSLVKHNQQERTQNNVVQGQYILYAVELTYTFARIMRQLRRWSADLTPIYLEQLFGPPPLM